jgi:hypothetical protein
MRLHPVSISSMKSGTEAGTKREHVLVLPTFVPYMGWKITRRSGSHWVRVLVAILGCLSPIGNVELIGACFACSQLLPLLPLSLHPTLRSPAQSK